MVKAVFSLGMVPAVIGPCSSCKRQHCSGRNRSLTAAGATDLKSRLIELNLAGFGTHLATEAFRFTIAVFTVKKWMGDDL